MLQGSRAAFSLGLDFAVQFVVAIGLILLGARLYPRVIT